MRYISLPAIVGICTCLALSGSWTAELAGQVAVWKAGQKDFPKPQAEPEPEAQPAPPAAGEAASQAGVGTVTLSPMEAPVPALKYRFWTSAVVRRHGSMNEAMSPALLLFLSRPNRETLDQQYATYGERWLESQTIDADLTAYLADQRELLDTIYRAAELDTIETRSVVRDLKGQAAVGAVLAEIQTLRSLVRLVQLDAHQAILERRYDHAIRSIAAGFRLAEYAQKIGDANMISGLVSLALSGLTLHAVDELSQQPQAPNLYWALASLPDELWSLRSAIEGESQSISRILYPLLEPVDPAMEGSDWNARLLQAVETIVVSGASPFDVPAVWADKEASGKIARLVVGTILLAFSDRAYQELIDAGYPSEQVQQMSAAEAVARTVQRAFERRRDDLFKWTLLGSLGESYSTTEWQRLKEQYQSTDFIVPATVLLGMVIPAIQAGEGAALRTNTQHKQLLLREALRAHAATHDGKLPDSLAELQPLPSLPDPSTGQLFEYQKLSDTEAIVRRRAFHPSDQKELRIKLQAPAQDREESR